MNNQLNEKLYGSFNMNPTEGVEATRLKFILEHIQDKHNFILDIGCWDGTYAALYKKKTNLVYAIESSMSAYKKALTKGIIVKHADFMKSNPFGNKKFDIIVAGEVIEHVYDTDLFLKKIHKILKKDGILLLTTPNVASLPRRILLLLGINPILENRFIPGYSVGHIRYFTFNDIEKLMFDNGFTITERKSDIVNFNNKGTLYSAVIPKIIPSFGRSIMIVAKLK